MSLLLNKADGIVSGMMDSDTFVNSLHICRSLAKKGPFTQERPPPTFDPISCIGSWTPRSIIHDRVKVYLNERPPWSELRVEFEKHSLERYAYLR